MYDHPGWWTRCAWSTHASRDPGVKADTGCIAFASCRQAIEQTTFTVLRAAPYLLVVYRSGEIELYDILYPTTPGLAGTISPSPTYRLRQVRVSGTTAYLTESHYDSVQERTSWHVLTYDVGDPTALAPLGIEDLGWHASSGEGAQILVLDPSHIVVGIPGVLFQILDVSDPENPAHVFTFFYPANGGMIARDKVLYVSNIDDWVTSPTRAVVPYDIDVLGNNLHLYGWNFPFPGNRYRYYHIGFDVTDPDDPQWLGTDEIPSNFPSGTCGALSVGPERETTFSEVFVLLLLLFSPAWIALVQRAMVAGNG